MEHRPRPVLVPPPRRRPDPDGGPLPGSARRPARPALHDPDDSPEQAGGADPRSHAGDPAGRARRRLADRAARRRRAPDRSRARGGADRDAGLSARELGGERRRRLPRPARGRRPAESVLSARVISHRPVRAIVVLALLVPACRDRDKPPTAPAQTSGAGAANGTSTPAQIGGAAVANGTSAAAQTAGTGAANGTSAPASAGSPFAGAGRAVVAAQAARAAAAARAQAAAASEAASQCATRAMAALKARDAASLADLAEPAHGVRFTPFLFPSPNDVVLGPALLRRAFSDPKVRNWGTAGESDDRIRATFAKYFARYVY